MGNHFHERILITEISPATRDQIAAIIDNLVELLDKIDGDADFEALGDEEEPILGWTEPTSYSAGAEIGQTPIDGDECEIDSDPEYSGDENEPTLGWIEMGEGESSVHNEF